MIPGEPFLSGDIELNDFLIQNEIFDVMTQDSNEGKCCASGIQIQAGEVEFPKQALQISKDTQLKRNRLAQKKFRDRQKAKIEQMQGELIQQKEMVDKLLAENMVLKKSIASLEKQHQYFETVSTESDLLVANKKDESYASPTPVLGEKSKSNDLFEERWQGMATSKTGLFLRKCWSRFAEEIRCLLAEHDASQSEDNRRRATERLSTHLDEGIKLHLRDVVPQRHLLQHCNATTYKEGDGLMSGTAVKWLSVVQDMGLHRLQMDQIVALKDAFMPRIQAKTSDQRAKLNDLQLSLAKLHKASSLHHLSADDLEELTEKVLLAKTSLQEQQECLFEFLVSFFQCDLQPVQMARCIAQSYPDYPDVCQIAHIVSEIRLQQRHER